MQEAAFHPLVRVEDVAEGSARRCVFRGEAIALFNVGGRIYATQDECTHGRASLSEGYVEGEEIECPLHQGVFNVRTGEAVNRPCVVPIRTYHVRIDDGVVQLGGPIDRGEDQ